jgi:hypothetical protein
MARETRRTLTWAVVLALGYALVTTAWAQSTTTTAVRPGRGDCVNLGGLEKGRSYPVTMVLAGTTMTIRRWSCAAEDGGADIRLRACSGTVCGPQFAFWSQAGGCGDGQPLTQTPNVALTGPYVVEALVETKSATTKSATVCLE